MRRLSKSQSWLSRHKNKLQILILAGVFLRKVLDCYNEVYGFYFSSPLKSSTLHDKNTARYGIQILFTFQRFENFKST